MYKIAMDLDGVICDSHSAFRLEFIKKYGHDINKPLKRGAKITYTITIPEVNNKIISKVIYETIANSWKDILPYDDAKEALTLFYSYYDRPVTIITARNPENTGVETATKLWLKTNFPEIEFEVIHKNHKTKAPYLKEHKFDTFVEDRLKNANEAADVVRRVFLIDRLWNINRESKPKVIRVGSLRQAILSILEGV